MHSESFSELRGAPGECAIWQRSLNTYINFLFVGGVSACNGSKLDEVAQGSMSICVEWFRTSGSGLSENLRRVVQGSMSVFVEWFTAQ